MKFTVLPFVVAMLVAVADMPTNVFQVCRRGLGHLAVDPWRLTAARDQVRAAVTWVMALLRFRPAFLAAAVVLALLAADLSASHTGVVVAMAAAGAPAEPTLAEVKTAIENSNRLFEEFKRTNDERIKQLEEKGSVDPLVTQKLEKLNKAIDEQSAVNEQFMQVRAVVDRLAAAGIQTSEAKAVEEKTLAKFNGELKATAMAAGRAFVPVDAAGLKAYNEAFDTFARRGANALTEAEKKALSVGSDVNGGNLVSPDTTGKAVQRIYETSPIRQYAATQIISTDALEGTVDLEEAAFGWVSELGSRSESTTPAVPKPWRIPVHEAYSEPRISQKLAEDANIDIAAWLARKVGDKFGRGYNNAFVVGNGVGKPRGFASYSTAATADGSRDWGTFEHVASGGAGAWGADPAAVEKLIDIIHALKDHFHAGAAFYMNRLTLGGLRKTTDASSAGKYVFVPSMQAGMPDMIMGYPARKLQDMASYTTADALAIAFGNMEETYQIVDRLGLTTLVDPYTAKPWIKYYTRGRVGGDVINFEALKFVKFAA